MSAGQRRASAMTPAALLLTLGFPPDVGGIQRLMHERCLLQPDTVAALAPAHPAASGFDPQQPFRIRRWPRWGSSAPGLRRLAQFALPLWYALRWRAVRPVGHLECGQTLPFGVAAWLLGRLWRVPYDVWAFGDDVQKAARHPALRPLARFVLRRARRVWAISEATRQIVLALGVAEESARVIHPWPAACFTPPTDDQGREAAVLLAVGRLERRKGMQAALRCCAQLGAAGTAACLVVVGDGAFRGALERLAAALRLADRVQFVGPVADADLAAWYRRATLLLFTPEPATGRGEMEGFGLVCVEAAACGCPVVAWDTGGVAEAVRHGETGIVVPYGDMDALSRAAWRLLASPDEAARLGRGGIQYATALRAAARRAFGPSDLP